MKYIFFALNIIVDLCGHLLMFLIWRYAFNVTDIYIQWALAFILLTGVFLTAVAPLLIHWRDNIFSHSIYLVTGLWLGFMLNTALVAAVFWPLSGLGLLGGYLSLPSLRYLAFGVLPVLMLLPEAWLAQAHKIRRLNVKIKDLPDAWSGREIIHVSDIHLGPIWRQRFFDLLVSKVNDIGADAIFITGDLFDGMDGDFSWFHQRKFFAPLGVYYAFGNHDLILGEEKVRRLLDSSNIQVLENELREVAGLQILGLSCYYQGRLDVEGKILSQLGYEPAKPSILMYHEPKDVEAARKAGINLQLSGHTHGGQMFPFNLVAHLLYRGFGSGLYYLHNFVLSVSVGAGTWGPPLRLGSRSEILVLKLLKE